MTQSDAKVIKKRGYTLREYLFVWAILIVPIIHFLVMYVFVKFDSLLLAFQRYEDGDYLWYGLNNFKQIFIDFFASEDGFMLKITGNSMLIFFVTMIWFPVPLFVSYIIWKKIPFAGAYKVILYLPSILPGMVTTLAFRYLVGLAFPEIFGNEALANLITNEETTNYTLYWYSRWIGLGGSLVIHLGAMSAVDQSLVEYGQLDGLNFFGEFWHIVLPKIWPTIVAILIGSFGSIFTADLGLYNFFREKMQNNPHSTLGYFITIQTLKGASNYGYLSALGLVTSFLTIPIVYGVKWLLEKFGPTEE